MKIIPQPKKFEKICGSFTINQDCYIYCDKEFKSQAERLVGMVLTSTGINVTFTDEIDNAKIIFSKYEDCGDEAYIVMLSQDILTVKANTFSGCFYAVETLRQLFKLDSEQQEISCVNCYIEDRPKYVHRGLLIDICRHFYGTDVLKQIIDIMSQVKLNKLHLHLSDDQGFRVQIDKYPLLNTVSSMRDGSEVVKNGKKYVEEEPHGGYLTKDEIREIVKYAAERAIDVIPEIDIPGHSVAALAAYPEYSCAGQIAEVRKQWGISKDILCAGNDGVYAFVCGILDEVCELFPSKYIHLGGDEVPKDRWCNCKLCREKLAELHLKDFDELQTYMVEVFRKHLEEKGKRVICWNDGITDTTDKEIISQVWKPFTNKDGIKDANNGRKVIMSPFFRTYFDYPYAMTPLSKTLRFKPDKGVKKVNRANVLGVEGCLWTEYVDSVDKLFFNLLPRVDVLSECAWGYRGKSIKKRIQSRFEIYDKMNVVCNKSGLRSKRNIRLINKFFKKNANIELERYLGKGKEKTL